MSRTDSTPTDLLEVGSSPAVTTAKVCSFLGVVDDAETYSLAIEVDNYCYNRRPKRSIDLEHQVRFCLAGAHAQCPFYKAPVGQSDPIRPLPVQTPQPVAAAAVAKDRSKPKKQPRHHVNEPVTRPVALVSKPDWQKKLVWAAAVTGLLAVMAVIMYFSFWARMDAQAAGSVRPVQANYLPPGQLVQVLVHVSGYNDDWAAVAARYTTSIEVLQVVNMQPDQPELTPGHLLVILPGVTNPNGLGRLQAYWNPEPKRVADAALEFGVSEEFIRFWNQIQGEWIEGQRWLVVVPLQQ